MSVNRLSKVGTETGRLSTRELNQPLHAEPKKPLPSGGEKTFSSLYTRDCVQSREKLAYSERSLSLHLAAQTLLLKLPSSRADGDVFQRPFSLLAALYSSLVCAARPGFLGAHSDRCDCPRVAAEPGCGR